MLLMVSLTVDTIGINKANRSPVLSLAPISSMTLMASMNRHLNQWIANVSNGAIDANDVIDSIGFHWRLWKTHGHRMAPMEPFELHHWSPMVIVIGAHRHRHQWIAINTIICRHVRKWCQWQEFSIVMTLLPKYLMPFKL